MARNGLLIFTLLFSPTAAAADPPREVHDAPRTRVVIVGVDGLSAEAVGRANCPVIHSLMRRGAWTLKARAVMPALSSPNWASILTGAGPEEHGITSNGWFKKMAEFQPTCSGRNGRFPTIFAWLRQQRPSAVSAVFHEWAGFARLVEPGVPDVIEHHNGAAPTMDAARQYWRVHRPDLLFVHLDIADHAGHNHGWNSPAYLQAVQRADLLIGQLVMTLDEQDALEDTLILITSDHGGSGHGHGRNSLADLEIPWIVSGPGVPAGVKITAPVSTIDTAPTIAGVLGIDPPECSVGRRVASAFSETGIRQARRTAIPAPPQPSSPTETALSAPGR